MIDILILYLLQNGILTMYGIRKSIETEFSSFTMPSFGTIKPALKRLENLGFITTQKIMSKGGRPSVYYAITGAGKIGLRGLLMSPVHENPVQFLNNSRIRLYCANCLDFEGLKELIRMLKLKAQTIYFETDKLLESNNEDFYKRIVYDNLNCEYKNFIRLLEGIERDCNH